MILILMILNISDHSNGCTMSSCIFFSSFSSAHTVWCREKYKVRVRALDVADRMSQFSSDAQMYFISSAQRRRLGRPRCFFEFDLVIILQDQTLRNTRPLKERSLQASGVQTVSAVLGEVFSSRARFSGVLPRLHSESYLSLTHLISS